MNKDTMRIEEFLLIIAFLIIIIGLLWQANISMSSRVSPAAQVQNMLASTPIAANTYLDDYSLYIPQGYQFEIEDNTVVVYNKESIMTFYMGQGVQLENSFFESMNEDMERLYGQSTSHDGVTTYTYAWQYDNSHVELLLGQNDSYIVAIYPEQKLDEAIVDITLIFNSYQRVENDQ